MANGLHHIRIHQRIPEANGERIFAECLECREFFSWVPRRIQAYTCEAGVTHRLYWRSHHRARVTPLFHCEHNSIVA